MITKLVIEGMSLEPLPVYTGTKWVKHDPLRMAFYGIQVP